MIITKAHYNQRVPLVYPENRTVSAAKIIMWAEDAFANGDVAKRPHNLAEAIALLEDAGIITAVKQRE